MQDLDIGVPCADRTVQESSIARLTPIKNKIADHWYTGPADRGTVAS